MAEWLRLADCAILTIKLRGINCQFAHLVSEKVHMARRVGFNHVRDSIWLAPKPIFYRGHDGREVKASRL